MWPSLNMLVAAACSLVHDDDYRNNDHDNDDEMILMTRIGQILESGVGDAWVARGEVKGQFYPLPIRPPSPSPSSPSPSSPSPLSPSTPSQSSLSSPSGLPPTQIVFVIETLSIICPCFCELWGALQSMPAMTVLPGTAIRG